MIRTLPELARAWWSLEEDWPDRSVRTYLHARPLAPVYRVLSRWDEEKRVNALARMVMTVSDRLHRLARVWQEWEEFDPGAFFDLYPEQVEALVSIRSSHHRVVVTFFTDVLIPAFQDAESFWVEEVVPALHVAQPMLLGNGRGNADPAGETWARLVAHELGPEMERRLYRAAREIQAVRDRLYEWGCVSFLATNTSGMNGRTRGQGGGTRHRTYIRERLALVPTLTMTLSFSTHAHAQQARLRALRRWLKRDWHRSRAR